MKNIIIFACLTFCSICNAFPPAPNFTFHGMIRDQVGQRLPGNSTSFVLLLSQGVEIGRAPITSGLLDQNYELNISVDTNRPGTVVYRDTALAEDAPIELAVELNGQRFYPIEVAGNLTIGSAGERSRLDLNLGVDSDGDGLPDTWEEWQLFQAGVFPDGNGNWDLSLINRNGDYDGDGQIDGLEYIAGTFAGDATENFLINLTSTADGVSNFTFYQVIGKTYTLERSVDLETWERVEFKPQNLAAALEIFQAQATGLLQAETDETETKAYYRLTVR